MSEEFFCNNRKKLFKELKKQSVAVLFAGSATIKRGDEYNLFSPDRNFYYLTGIESENFILFLGNANDNEESILYIERDNGYLANWVGTNMTTKEAYDESGISDVRYLDEFHSDISSYIFKNSVERIYLDLENRDWKAALTPALLFADEIKKRYPSLKIKDSYNVFGEFRECKEEYELKLMQKAIDITGRGIEEMMKNAKAGMIEYEIEAYFDFVLTREGVRQKAFQTIAASGKNGTILHYVKNNKKTQDNDLLLVDAGAMVGWYNGDLTRTFPVSGKFTDRQKIVYEIVLSGQQKVIDAIKPGIMFSSLNEILKEHYFLELKKIGLLKTKDEVFKYYYHQVSHYLGAETHDIGKYIEKQLKEGMVITVEPGLYIKEWEIGIRIEDDVFVSKNGYEILSKHLIKTVSEIEEFMKKS